MAKSKKSSLDWSSISLKKFVFKFAYLGSSYLGNAYQEAASGGKGGGGEGVEDKSLKPQPESTEDEMRVVLSSPPTIERDIFIALLKSQLIKSRASSDFSRCGRTDKGVHAAGNYFSVSLRVGKDGAQLEYLKILNGLLPPQVRVLDFCEVSPSFDARFSCLRRVYKYFMYNYRDLDVKKMFLSAQFLRGEHDFRNFCKMDPAQTDSFRRKIFRIDFKILPRVNCIEITVQGSAFLWHQIRCIVSLLKMVGEGKEDLKTLKTLLNIEKMPQKPIYPLADPAGLVLYECIFPAIPFSKEESFSTDFESLPGQVEGEEKMALMKEEGEIGSIFQEIFKGKVGAEGDSCPSPPLKKAKASSSPSEERELPAASFEALLAASMRDSAVLQCLCGQELPQMEKREKHTPLLKRGRGPTLEEKKETLRRRRERKEGGREA